MKDIGKCIQFHRKQAGLSRVALAELAGVGKTVIYDVEHGKQSIRLDSLLKIAEALNISVALDSPLMQQYEESSRA